MAEAARKVPVATETKAPERPTTLQCEKEEEKEEKKKDYYLRERHFGSFERQLAVPEGVDTDKIEASFKKGVLTITLPKKPVWWRSRSHP